MGDVSQERGEKESVCKRPRAVLYQPGAIGRQGYKTMVDLHFSLTNFLSLKSR